MEKTFRPKSGGRPWFRPKWSAKILSDSSGEFMAGVAGTDDFLFRPNGSTGFSSRCSDDFLPRDVFKQQQQLRICRPNIMILTDKSHDQRRTRGSLGRSKADVLNLSRAFCRVKRLVLNLLQCRALLRQVLRLLMGPLLLRPRCPGRWRTWVRRRQNCKAMWKQP